MSVQELNESNLANVLAENDIVIIDFWAPWCGPCRQFAPIFEAASEAHPDIVFAKVNTEEEQTLAASFRIRSIPTLMIFREKVMLFNQAGALPPAALEDLITQVKALDMAKIHEEIAAQQTGTPQSTQTN